MNKSIIGTLTDKTIKIRNLKEKEEYIKEVAILEHEEWAENPEENKKERIERKINRIKNKLGNKDFCKLILLKDEDLVGFISIFPNDCDECPALTPWYATMYIKEKYRGKGYSKILNEEVLNEAKKRGYKEIFLKTELSNYYEKFGAIYIRKLKTGEKLYKIELWEEKIMETQRNEITVKINATMEEIHKIIKEKEYEEIDKFSLDDTYFIPENLDIEKISTREILAKALIIRRIKRGEKIIKQITFKIKNIDSKGNILSQKSINCEIKSIEDAKKLLQAIGYREIMNIKENDTEYRKNGFQLAIKDIINGDKLIEIEENEKYDTIEKIIKELEKQNIPIFTDNYFVKKAEVELNKILNRK